MYDIHERIACAEEHYQALLKDAELNRRFNGKARYQVQYLTVARNLLLTFANLLIRAGTWLKTVSGAIPLSVPRDEATHNTTG